MAARKSTSRKFPVPLEHRIKASIVRALEEQGAYVHVTPPLSRGLPDLLVCFNGRFYGIEVKRPGKQPSAAQLSVGRAIVAAGGIWGVAKTVMDAMTILGKGAK